MSPRQCVCGSASNSSHVKLARGRGPLCSVNRHALVSTSGVGPIDSTGKSSVWYCPGGRRCAMGRAGRLPVKPRVVIGESKEGCEEIVQFASRTAQLHQSDRESYMFASRTLAAILAAISFAMPLHAQTAGGGG